MSSSGVMTKRKLYSIYIIIYKVPKLFNHNLVILSKVIEIKYCFIVFKFMNFISLILFLINYFINKEIKFCVYQIDKILSFYRLSLFFSKNRSSSIGKDEHVARGLKFVYTLYHKMKLQKTAVIGCCFTDLFRL